MHPILSTLIYPDPHIGVACRADPSPGLKCHHCEAQKARKGVQGAERIAEAQSDIDVAAMARGGRACGRACVRCLYRGACGRSRGMSLRARRSGRRTTQQARYGRSEPRCSQVTTAATSWFWFWFCAAACVSVSSASRSACACAAHGGSPSSSNSAHWKNEQPGCPGM